MEDKHFIYGLKTTGSDQYFYIGWSQQDTPESRLRQHLYGANHPNQEEQLNRVIRGGPSGKDSMIIDHPDAIEIDVLIEAELHEPLDEAEYIVLYRELGHDLQNVATGSIWCPQPKQFVLESYKPKAKPKKRISKPLAPSVNPYSPQETYDKMLNLWIDSLEYSVKLGCNPDTFEDYWPGSKLHECYNSTDAALLHKSFQKSSKKNSLA